MPVLFFAEMPTMVAPQHDNGVVIVWPIFEGIENPAQHGVGKMDRGKVALDSLLPLILFADMSEVSIWSSSLSGRWEIVKVVFFVAGRKLDVLQRKRLIIFGGNEPRFMRAVDTAGEKEGLFVFL